MLDDYERLQSRLKMIIALIEKLISKVPYAEKLMQIKCIGMKTVSGFIAEVGDISRFTDPKQDLQASSAERCCKEGGTITNKNEP